MSLETRKALVLAHFVLFVGCTRDEACGGSDLPPSSVLVAPSIESSCGGRSATPVRLMSWNIRAGRELGLEAIIELIGQVDADVVLLQEVDVGTERTGKVDQPAVIAGRLGYAYAFAAAVEVEGGLFGVATLSRLPFCSVERLPLSNRDACEPRTALDACICSQASPLRVVNHHADWTEAGATQSIEEVLASVVPWQGPLLLAGDLNQEPFEHGPRACVQAGLVDALHTRDARPTYERRRIDYFFLDPDTAELVSAASVITTEASDHDALVVEIQPP